MQAGSANAQHVREMPDRKHGARNTCLYKLIFIQFLPSTKDSIHNCQQSLQAGCPNYHLPRHKRNVQNNLRTSSSRQAASSIPRVYSSRLVPLTGIKSIIYHKPSNSEEPWSHSYATGGTTDDVRIIEKMLINFGPRPSVEKCMVKSMSAPKNIVGVKTEPYSFLNSWLVNFKLQPHYPRKNTHAPIKHEAG
jgi:hypothetical protein